MRPLWVMFGIAVLLPLLVIVAIAAGPALLVILFVAICALLVLTVERLRLRHGPGRRMAPRR